MLRVTLMYLFDKVEELNGISKLYDVKYYLVVVPELYSDNEDVHQILSLDSDIIEFLYLTKTIYDLDYYVY